MNYRNGNYIAFDGLGEKDPTKSDFKYYAIIEGWALNKDFDFKYINSHEKTYAVKDSSSKETLKNRINERLAKSKNILIILSDQTRKTGSILSYEIEQAIDTYKLPLICAYVGLCYVGTNIYDNSICINSRWPDTLEKYINNNAVKALHIPFKKEILLNAITNQTVNNNTLTSGLNYYTYEAQEQLGCFDNE